VARKPKLGSIYQRGGVWWLKYYRNGKPFRESSRSHIYAEAERMLKRRLGELVTGKFTGLEPERIRVRQLTDLVVQEYKENGRSSLPDIESRLKLHLLPQLGDIRVAEFGTQHVKRYVALRQREEAANASINRELAIVKRAFNLGFRNDPPLVNRLVYIPTLAENNVRTGFLNHDTYTKLRNELPESVRPLFVVGYHTGARIGELIHLRWKQVDLAARRITLDPGTTKNREGRTLPIYGEMHAWLSMQQTVQQETSPDCDSVFQRWGRTMGEFYKSWRSACKRAGVPGLLFHDLRRTAVRNMVRAGISEKVAMKISGHKTRSVFDRYDIVNERDLSEAAAKMERHLDRMGTVSGTVATDAPPDSTQADSKSLTAKESVGGPCWIRTNDQRIMSPLH
jgi:integrase